MADEENKVSASKKDIYTKLLDIAGKYTDIENTNYLKTGLFGYITESMAMMIRDSSLQKNMLYKESTLNTAIIPQTVYNWAKMFNIEVNRAYPAYGTINIIINSDALASACTALESYDINRYGSDIKKDIKGIIINKEDPIIAGEYYFSLEHSIMIYENNSGYQAKYILSEYESTNYQTISSAYLPIIYSEGNIVIEARAYQYKLTKVERQLTSSSFANKIQLFNFDDQFAGAKLFYKDYQSSKQIELRYSNIDDASTDVDYAYYNLNSEHELEIVFKSGDGCFVPSANSKITAYIYTTKGTNVPMNFTGTAVFRFSNEILRRLGILVSFNPTNIIGGQDVPSLEKLKATIIKQLSTCNTIVTESDLNNYFEMLTNTLETINDGKVKFIKRRDDILKRIFDAYILMRTGLTEDNKSKAETKYISKCVPTNTITATINGGDLQTQTMIYPKFIEKTEVDTYEYSTTLNRNTTDYYFSPFYIFIVLSPFKKMKFIYNLTDNTSGLSFKTDNINSSTEEYINPISIRLYRGLDASTGAQKNYTLSFKFSTNMSETVLTEKFGEATLNLGTSQQSVSALLYKLINPTITIDSDNSTAIVSYQLENNAADEFKINDYGNVMYLNEKMITELQYIDLLLSDNTEFISDDPLYFFRNLDDIMTTDISINYDKNNAIASVEVSDIPVIHSSYFNTIGNSDGSDLVEELFEYIKILKDNLEKLETSTFFNLKFYNTYGYSRYHNVTRTNVDLELHIHLNSDYTTNSDALKSEIRSYIRRAFDKSNENGEIKISAIIGLLGKDETYGKYIDYVEFKGLNGTYTQYVKELPDTDTSIYIPEWINLDSANIDSMIEID